MTSRTLQRVATWGLLLCAVPVAMAQSTRDFPMVGSEPLQGITSLASLNHTPAGKFGPITAGPDGHLYAGSQRVRFFGINTCFAANFPQPADSPIVAARLASLGFNMVRLHHMDMFAFPSGLKSASDAAAGSLSPQGLDRLGTFVDALKQQGVYVNINLLVARKFQAADGIAAEVAAMPPRQQAQAGFFHQPLQAAQKNYAKALLGYQPAAWKHAFSADPAVAVVEIANEVGLVDGWFSGSMDSLPPVLAADLRARWNAFLVARYATDAGLAKAWQVTQRPLGAELLDRPTPDDPGRWRLEQHAGSASKMTIAAPKSGPWSADIRTTTPGKEEWHVMLNHAPIAVRKGGHYTLHLDVDVAQPTRFQLSIGQDHEPWQLLTRLESLALPKGRHTLDLVLQAEEGDPKARLSIAFGKTTGSVTVTGASFREGGVVGPRGGQSLAAGTMPLVVSTRRNQLPSAASRDFLAFLRETEKNYWTSMRQYVRETLGYKGLVMGTIISNSMPTVQSAMDAVDSHAYWHHPEFPRKGWDPEDWTVKNDSHVDYPGGSVTRLAMQRVAGKPFFCTEYNHSAPNSYSSEAPLFLGAMAAAQDWDAVFLFAYSHSGNWNLTGYNSFFDLVGHSAKLANVVPAAAMFRRGDLRPLSQSMTVPFSPDRELSLLVQSGHAWRPADLTSMGMPPETARWARWAMDTSAPTDAPVPPLPTRGDASFAWTASGPGTGQLRTTSPASASFVGFIGANQSVALGPWKLKVGKTKLGWCTAALTAMQGDSLAKPGRALLVLTGSCENRGMRWKDDTYTSVGKAWGQGPAVVETVAATLDLRQSAATVWSLLPSGQRDREIRPDQGTYPLGTSLWYEIETR